MRILSSFRRLSLLRPALTVKKVQDLTGSRGNLGSCSDSSSKPFLVKNHTSNTLHFIKRSYCCNAKEECDTLLTLWKEGKLKEYLKLMENQRDQMDTYMLLMNECGESQALEEAKEVHAHLKKTISHLNVSITNKILEMYGKCGAMQDARNVFDKMPQRNLTSWDTMITWLAKNGHGEEAIQMFTEFKSLGLKLDNQMFLGVFMACSVVGDMGEGLLHFETLIKTYNLVPSMDVYVSLVKMFSSAGYLNDALEFIQKMPIEPSVEIWEVMMNQSRVHGDLELGDRCAQVVDLLDPSHLDEQSKAGLIPKKKEKKKIFHFLWRGRYEFTAGDTSHSHYEKLYSQLRCLKQHIIVLGYVPDTQLSRRDVDNESKANDLLTHSERLVLAQKLLTSHARAPIIIMKTLCTCYDCHNALKILSKVVGRDILSQDEKRYHHMKNGVCSCGDFW